MLKDVLVLDERSNSERGGVAASTVLKCEFGFPIIKLIDNLLFSF